MFVILALLHMHTTTEVHREILNYYKRVGNYTTALLHELTGRLGSVCTIVHSSTTGLPSSNKF